MTHDLFSYLANLSYICQKFLFRSFDESLSATPILFRMLYFRRGEIFYFVSLIYDVYFMPSHVAMFFRIKTRGFLQCAVQNIPHREKYASSFFSIRDTCGLYCLCCTTHGTFLQNFHAFIHENIFRSIFKLPWNNYLTIADNLIWGYYVCNIL